MAPDSLEKVWFVALREDGVAVRFFMPALLKKTVQQYPPMLVLRYSAGIIRVEDGTVLKWTKNWTAPEPSVEHVLKNWQTLPEAEFVRGKWRSETKMEPEVEANLSTGMTYRIGLCTKEGFWMPSKEILERNYRLKSKFVFQQMGIADA